MKKIFDLTRGAPPLYTVPIDAFIGKYDGLLGMNEVIEKYSDSLTYKGSGVAGHNFRGFGPLRELLAKRHGVEASQILVRNGGMDAMDAFFVYLNRKIELSGENRKPIVVTECPTYDRFPDNLMQHRIKWDAVLMKEDGVDIKELENVFKTKKVDAFYGIYEGQNPSSYSYTAEKLKSVEYLCKKYGVLVLWDGAYHNLTYGRVNSCVTNIAPHVIYAYNYTKEVSAGAKVGYLLIGDENISNELFQVVSSKGLNPVYPIQSWYYEFLNSEYYEENLEKLRNMYGKRAEKFVSIMNEHLGACKYNKKLDSGFFINIKFPGITNHDEFMKKLELKGIKVSDSRQSYHPKYRNHANGVIRVPFAVLDEEDIEELILRLKEL